MATGWRVGVEGPQGIQGIQGIPGPISPDTVLKGTLVYSVKDYGAVGNGTTDDAVAIQAAIDACAATGGTVFFPPGTYAVGTTLILKSSVHLRGAGPGGNVFSDVDASLPWRGSTIKLKSGANVDLIRTANFTALSGIYPWDPYTTPNRFGIYDLVLDGNNFANTAGWCLQIAGFSYWIQNVVIQNGASGGAHSEGPHTAGFDNESQWVNFRICFNKGIGLDFDGPHDSLISNGFVSVNGTDQFEGIRFGTWCGSTQVSNVHVWGSHTYGISIASSDMSFSNCVSEGATRANVLLLSGNVRWSGGSLYATNIPGEVLLQVGDGNLLNGNPRVITGAWFSTRWWNLAPGSVALRYMNNTTTGLNLFAGSLGMGLNTRATAGNGKTTLVGDQGGTSTTTLTVADTSSFPTSGTLDLIDAAGNSCHPTYTGKTGTTFTGVAGMASTIYPSGTVVWQALGNINDHWLLYDGGGNSAKSLLQLQNPGGGQNFYINCATTFTGPITMNDTNNFVFSTLTGTKIGTATNQKLGFYNAAPVVQRTPSGTFQSALTALSDLGLAAPATAAIVDSDIATGAAIAPAKIAGTALTLGGGTLTGPVLLPDGSGAAPALSFANETNSGIYRAGNGDFRFVTAGTTRATWTASGIGSSSGFQLTGASSKLAWTALTAATTVGFGIKVAGDTQDRLVIRADGGMAWGTGALSQDILLRRSSTTAKLLIRDGADTAFGDMALRTLQVDDGAVGAPTVTFTNSPTTGIWRKSADNIGFATAGVDRVSIDSNGLALNAGLLRLVPAGSAANPVFTWAGDPNTGIYSPGADQVSITTGGVDRLIVSSVGQLFPSLGSATAPVYSFQGDSNTGIYSPAADEWAVSTAGVQRVHVDATGKVGISGVAAANAHLRLGWSGFVGGFFAAAGGTVYGLQSEIVNTLSSSVVGASLLPWSISPSTVPALRGIDSGWRINHVSCVLTAGYSFNAISPVVSAGSAGTSYGLYIAQQKVTGVTTGYGVYQADAGDLNYFAGQSQFQSGTTALPGVSFVGDPNTGMWNPGADEIAFSTGGTERLRLNGSGLTFVNNMNVNGSNNAILVSSQSAASNSIFSAKVAGDAANRFSFQVGGNIYWGPGNVGQDMMLKRGSATALSIRDAADTVDRDLWVRTITPSGVIQPGLGTVALPSYTFNGDPNTGVYSPAADEWAVTTAGVQRVHVDATGKIGLGAAAITTNSLKLGSGSTDFNSGSTVTGLSIGTGNTGSGPIYGIEVVPISQFVGTVGQLRGTSSGIRVANAGTTVTDGYAVYSRSPLMSSGALGTSYGLYVQQQKVAGVTTGYGIYQVDAGDLNYFAGAIGLGAAVSTDTLLRVGTTGGPFVFNSASTVYGVNLNIKNDGLGATVGILSNPVLSGSGTGTATSLVALLGTMRIANSNLTITNGFVFKADPPTVSGGTIGTLHGVYVGKMNAAGVTTSWGVYQEDAGDKNRFNGQVQIADGTVGAPGIAFANEPSSGLWRNTANDVRLAVGGVVRAIFTSGGISTGQNVSATGNVSGAILLAGDGSAATPSIGFTSTTGMGLYRKNSGQISTAVGGIEIFTVDGTGVIVNTGSLRFTGLGSVGSPAITFSSDPNTGTYSPAADEWAVTTGGSQRLHIDNTGSMGLHRTAVAGYQLIIGVGATNSGSTLTGISTTPGNAGVGNLIGINGAPIAQAAGTTASVKGVTAGWRSANAAQIVTDGRAFDAQSPLISSGTAGTAYGLYIAQQKVTGVTTGYGIWQHDGGDINVFRGETRLSKGMTVLVTESVAVPATTALSVGIAGAGGFASSSGVTGISTVLVNSGLGDVTGVYSEPFADFVGTIANCRAFRGRPHISGTAGCIVTTAIGFNAAPPITGAAGVITNAYGLYIEQQKVTGVGTGWGVYQADAGDKNFFAGQIQSALGAVGTPAYSFTGDPDTGMYSPVADQLAFATAGAARLTISTVGTITVNAQIRSQANGTAAAPVYSWANDVDTGMYNPSADLLVFSTGATDRLRLDAGGSMLFGASVTVGDGGRVIGIQNAAVVPTTNPTNGGVLYSEGGLLKWRGSDGVVTTMAPASVPANISATTVTASSYFSAPQGNAGAPGYAFTGELDCGFYISGVNKIGVSTAGAARWEFGLGDITALGNGSIGLLNQSGVGSYAMQIGLTGEANPKFVIKSDGSHHFGPGGATGLEIMIRRSNSSSLKIRDTADTVDRDLGVGSLYATAQIFAPDGSISSPSYSFTNDSDTGMFLQATNSISFVTGGAERMRLNGSGNLIFGALAASGGGGTVMAIQNATTVPTSNSGNGGILYAEGGALKWRGSSGTVTVLAPA